MSEDRHLPKTATEWLIYLLVLILLGTFMVGGATFIVVKVLRVMEVVP